MEPPGGVPAGTGGEFPALTEHHILPTELRKVKKHAASDDPATDHHYLRVRFHVKPACAPLFMIRAHHTGSRRIVLARIEYLLGDPPKSDRIALDRPRFIGSGLGAHRQGGYWGDEDV